MPNKKNILDVYLPPRKLTKAEKKKYKVKNGVWVDVNDKKSIELLKLVGYKMTDIKEDIK